MKLLQRAMEYDEEIFAKNWEKIQPFFSKLTHVRPVEK